MSERQFPVRTLLFISLLMNVLAIGAAGGAYFSGARLQRPATEEALVDRLPGPRAFVRSLPEDARAAMRERFRQTWTETRDVREAVREARLAAFEAASAEPFDAARVKAAFARMRAADQAAIGVFHEATIDAFAEMTPAQRSAAIEALRRAPPARRAGPAAGEAPAGTAEPNRSEKLREWRERRRERREERLQEQQKQP